MYKLEGTNVVFKLLLLGLVSNILIYLIFQL